MKYRVWIAFGAVLLAATSVSATDIGAVAAVNRDVQGARPTEAPRRLELNERLIQNERITTSAESGGQVLFLDQTTLTLTPNSDIILDKYVFDPAADKGELAITMLKGAMRMVGGRITKSAAATIRTPSATIGIRGGIGNITVREDGSTEYMHIAGFSATITNEKNKSITITREGGMAEVSPPSGGTEAFVDAAVGGSPTGGADRSPAGNDSSGASSESSTANAGETGEGGGGQITYMGVATPEQVRATMSVRAGQGDGGSDVGRTGGRIQAGIPAIEQQISARPNAIADAPISTTGERQDEDFAPQPVNLDDRPIEEFTDNEVAMATEAEEAARQIAQELNAVSFNGVWSATAGLTSGGFAATEDNLAFRMQYSLLDQQGFATVELPGGLDGVTLTTFDGATVVGDRFLIVGDDGQNLVADGERLTLLGGDADGTAVAIGMDDIANGAVFIDYEDAALDQLQFVDGQIADLAGERFPTTDIRSDIEILQQTLAEPGN